MRTDNICRHDELQKKGMWGEHELREMAVGRNETYDDDGGDQAPLSH